jgi:hypothetical protein
MGIFIFSNSEEYCSCLGTDSVHDLFYIWWMLYECKPLVGIWLGEGFKLDDVVNEHHC